MFPTLVMASLWYLAMTSVLMVGQYYIERYYARGSVRSLPPTPLQTGPGAAGAERGAAMSESTGDAGAAGT